MAEAKEKKKRSIAVWWSGIRSEWGKIVWPDRKKVGRQTLATIVVSAIIAVLIVFFDMIIRFGIDRVMTLGG